MLAPFVQNFVTWKNVLGNPLFHWINDNRGLEDITGLWLSLERTFGLGGFEPENCRCFAEAEDSSWCSLTVLHGLHQTWPWHQHPKAKAMAWKKLKRRLLPAAAAESSNKITEIIPSQQANPSTYHVCMWVCNGIQWYVGHTHMYKKNREIWCIASSAVQHSMKFWWFRLFWLPHEAAAKDLRGKGKQLIRIYSRRMMHRTAAMWKKESTSTLWPSLRAHFSRTPTEEPYSKLQRHCPLVIESLNHDMEPLYGRAKSEREREGERTCKERKKYTIRKQLEIRTCKKATNFKMISRYFEAGAMRTILVAPPAPLGSLARWKITKVRNWSRSETKPDLTSFSSFGCLIMSISHEQYMSCQKCTNWTVVLRADNWILFRGHCGICGWVINATCSRE